MIRCPTSRSPTSIKQGSRPNIKQAGVSLVFAHGFNVHYGQVRPGADRRLDGRPKAPATVRGTARQSGGVPHLIAAGLPGHHRKRVTWPCLYAAVANGGGKAASSRPLP